MTNLALHLNLKRAQAISGQCEGGGTMKFNYDESYLPLKKNLKSKPSHAEASGKDKARRRAGHVRAEADEQTGI